ncbi:MAG TPA: DUF6225 family protein [Micromonosporaceae bacterium]|nr:DUF6225 family protein [Micromonosporaceae bacterium]
MHHRVDEWAVGHLRPALGRRPDHLPVRVLVAEAPGGEIAAIQVVCDADVVDQAALGAGPTSRSRAGIPLWFEVSCEYPSGVYPAS